MVDGRFTSYWIMGGYRLPVLLLWLCPLILLAQSKYPLQLTYTNTADSVVLAKLTDSQTTFNHAEHCRQTLATRLTKLQTNGYLAASFDSLVIDSVAAKASFYLGNQYQWATLDVSQIPKNMLAASGYRSKNFQQQSFSPRAIIRLQERLLRYAENNGYPFASVRLTNIELNGNQFSASLQLDKGNLISMDSIVVVGDAKISNAYLRNYLGIKQKHPYNESTVEQISGRVKELPFLQEVSPPKVLFLDTRAKVNLFLKRKKASRFNLVLGILPKPPTTGPAGNSRQRFEIIGDGQLYLANALGAGEKLDIDFKSYVNKRRELKAHILYPYLPLVPVGIDARFELFIADTLFRDVKTYLGLQYSSKGNNYLKAFLDRKNSVLLTVDSVKLAAQKRLPEVLDVKYTLYGFEFHQEQLDYRFNPRKGYLLNMLVGAGLKKVAPNLNILSVGEALEIDFQNQYDSLNQNRLQYRLQAKIEKYWPIGKLSVIKTGFTGAYLGNKHLLQNELYRIGGNRILRGFDEESIWASFYAVATLEYRFILSQNANFFAFFDGANVQNRSRNTDTKDYPFGFGLGANLETKAGIFGLMYALGRQQDNPINFRQGKIHFGYVAYF